MEQKNGQTEQGTAMPDQSDLERKRQMHNALCVNDTAAATSALISTVLMMHNALCVNDTAAYCCDLKTQKVPFAVGSLQFSRLLFPVACATLCNDYFSIPSMVSNRWYQNLRAAGGLQWSGRHGGNAYE